MDVLSDGAKRSGKRAWISVMLFQLSALSPTLCPAQQPLADPTTQAQTESVAAAPYVVFVAETEAFTRCGPGQEHYRTDPLRRGQELEVYVETEDGWLGVRPPDESFCWMPADAVQLSSDSQSATIIEDGTVAWIGTRLGQARRYRWQVQLNAGETVVVLGQTERQGENGSKSWLRIVPPSGEFRWIHRDQIVESAEELADKIASQASQLEEATKVATVSDLSTDRDVIDADELQRSESAATAAIDTEDTAMQTAALQTASSIPDLRPAPGPISTTDERIADRALQFHRGARAEDFEDRGAVIGSGLKSEWREPSTASDQSDQVAQVDDSTSRSVLSNERLPEGPSSGAAAAAAAIAMPLKKVTDVVANFISPPRIVAIDPSHPNVFAASTPADRRWMVGTDRHDDSRFAASTPTPPSSLAAPAYDFGSAAGPGIGPQIAPASALSALYNNPAMVTTAGSVSTPKRIISVAQIARVEDAVHGADVDSLGQILSKLMAEAASAEEIAPLIRRTETLLRSGDVNRATETRDLLDLAQRYQNVAARRDGVTMIQSQSLATMTSPVPLVNALPNATNNAALSPSQAVNTTPYATDWSQSLSPSANAAPIAPLVSAMTTSQSSTIPATIESPLAPLTGNATGYLVQVYSSRADSPPFALTDDAGMTVAYVTPYPGVNLRNHLNSRIAVSGSEKMLEGMSTPHILVDRAIRR